MGEEQGIRNATNSFDTYRDEQIRAVIASNFRSVGRGIKMDSAATSAASISSTDRAASASLHPTDDPATRGIVQSQLTIEAIVGWAILALGGFYTLYQFRNGAITGVLTGMLMLFVCGTLLGVVEACVFRPARYVRFGACVAQMRAEMIQRVTPAKERTWKAPLPAILALDTERRLLAIESPDTDYQLLTLRPDQILDVKIEREQITKTTTKYSSRLFLPDLGIIGRGRSSSTSKTIERAFLELVFVLRQPDIPGRAVFNFGNQRREADDWLLAIRNMRDDLGLPCRTEPVGGVKP